MLTKGRFTRDEWDHLLRFLNSMNVSMFSCSHFLPNRKQTVMSKRAQESTAEGSSVVAKRRPMSLVSRNLPSAKKTPPQDSSATNSPENQELDQSYVSSSVRKLVRNNNQDPTAYSQQRWQDDTLSSSTWKLVPIGESASSASTRKTGARRWQWNRKDEDGIPQYANLRPSIPWKGLRDWHWNMKPKFWMYHRLVGQVPHGRDLRLHKRKQSSRRKQNFTSTQIPSCAWGWCKSIKKRTKDGMINLKNFNNPILTENYLELMENRLSSSGIFSQDLLHWRSSRWCKKDLQNQNKEPENFEERITFMSMFNDIDWTKTEIQKDVFRIPNMSRTPRRDSREDTRHS